MDDTRVDFLFTLYFIGRKVKGHYKEANKDLMLSAAILHLLQKQEYTLSQLAKILYSKLSSLSEKITAMEVDGLVKKISKEGDEREQCISLTTMGKKKVEKILAVMKQHCMEFTDNISNEDLNKINPILKKMVA
ncbi:MAG: winged helix DNA-binding protein [Candidatus Roizmanbacteria bacterium]|nr:winged helix DNA-binding protein [Candidatus Roizmanbacteria bacterium]